MNQAHPSTAAPARGPASRVEPPRRSAALFDVARAGDARAVLVASLYRQHGPDVMFFDSVQSALSQFALYARADCRLARDRGEPPQLRVFVRRRRGGPWAELAK